MDRDLLERLSRITQEEQDILDGRSLNRGLAAERDDFVVDFSKKKGRERLISIRPHTRFVDFPEHRHNYVEMMYQCQGHTRHLLQSEVKLDLKAGEFLLLNQHVSHAVAKAGREDVAVNIVALPGFFDYALKMSGEDNELLRFLLTVFRDSREEAVFIHYRLGGLLPLRNLMENMIWMLLYENPADEQISKMTMATLLLSLSRYAEPVVLNTADPEHAVVAEALRQVDAHYNAPSLGLIAKRYHVSPAYVSAAVKRQTGKTFTELLQQKRMKLAAELLLNPDLTVSEISGIVGYRNSSYFYSLFSEYFKMSPLEFRQKERLSREGGGR